MEEFKGLKVKLKDFEILKTLGTGNHINLFIHRIK